MARGQAAARGTLTRAPTTGALTADLADLNDRHQVKEGTGLVLVFACMGRRTLRETVDGFLARPGFLLGVSGSDARVESTFATSELAERFSLGSFSHSGAWCPAESPSGDDHTHSDSLAATNQTEGAPSSAKRADCRLAKAVEQSVSL